MSDPRYIRDDFDHFLAHVGEEAGELAAAVCKTVRWGWQSINPELREGEKHWMETNINWVQREMRDLREAMDRLQKCIDEGRLP